MAYTQVKTIKTLEQPFFPTFDPIESAVRGLAEAGVEERGAIFTKPEVVNFILDLIGYTPDMPLNTRRLLEPSFGEGDFLLIAADRLLESYRSHSGAEAAIVNELSDAIYAVELHKASFQKTRQRLLELLESKGVDHHHGEALANAWLQNGDFLLTELPHTFTHVVGNPPYVRQELIPDALIEAYRARFETIFDRADLYIPFIEKSLRHLAPGGALGFICADRWMKNRYGGPLRNLVAKKFHLKTYVDMVDTPAFYSDVIAYPAITVITNEKGGATRIAHRPDISADHLTRLANALLADVVTDASGNVKEIAHVARGSEPWILESSDQLSLVRRLERDFPTIEETGCTVGIGVATGADKAFIGKFDELDVEPDRKLPLVMTRDIQTGTVQWRGLGVVNPFNDTGGLVDLRNFPKLATYLNARKEHIAKRHIATKNPQRWYRTIDRIYPALARKPMLLIPDIKGEAHVVYEGGQLYPHHNLYFITSEEWSLKALQAVLRSGIARLFVSTYSTKMRGGFLRFQAQYLRRIRVPQWKDVSEEVRRELISAAEKGDTAACNEAVFKLYRFSKRERAALGGNGNGG